MKYSLPVSKGFCGDVACLIIDLIIVDNIVVEMFAGFVDLLFMVNGNAEVDKSVLIRDTDVVEFTALVASSVASDATAI